MDGKRLHNTIQYCREEIANIKGKDLVLFLKPKIEALITKFDYNTGRMSISYQIGRCTIVNYQSENESFTVCRKAFCIAYGVTDFALRSAIDLVKNGRRNDESDFTDRTCVSAATAKAIRNIGKDFIGTEALANLEVANGPRTSKAREWMRNYFQLVGDVAPNRKEEIHLEPGDKKEIWKNYVCDMHYVSKESSFLSYNRFCELWATAFKFVKIREYKQVIYSLAIDAFLLSVPTNFSL